jgi:PAS domain-containing protein
MLSPLQLGSEIQVLTVVHDVSERWQAQEARRRSEERFREVFERSPLGLALIRNPLDYMRMLHMENEMLIPARPRDLALPGPGGLTCHTVAHAPATEAAGMFYSVVGPY